MSSTSSSSVTSDISATNAFINTLGDGSFKITDNRWYGPNIRIIGQREQPLRPLPCDTVAFEPAHVEYRIPITDEIVSVCDHWALRGGPSYRKLAVLFNTRRTVLLTSSVWQRTQSDKFFETPRNVMLQCRFLSCTGRTVEKYTASKRSLPPQAQNSDQTEQRTSRLF